MSQNAFAQIERETNEAEGLREHARMERMEMTEQKKDYSKLRPFDLEAAKRGEPICDAYGNTLLFIAEAGEDGEHAIRAFCGNMALCEGKRMRMKPLAWVEGKPVYKGDVLYKLGERFEVFGIKKITDGTEFLILRKDGLNTEYADNCRGYLTWNQPKVKREGWVNVYGVGDAFIYSTEREANDRASDDRITCVRIEWEEEAND